MSDLGYRISDLKSIPVTSSEDKLKNKILFDNTYLLSYSHTVYGINYNRNNYKIPLTSLRDDLKSYIGIESLVAPWSEQMKLWHGVWHDTTSRNRSYTHVWEPSEALHEHYSPEKFSDLDNSYYIIKDAPFPYETGDLNNRPSDKTNTGEKEAVTLDDGTVVSINLPIKAADPYPDSNKIVTKKYVDERLASKRIVEVATEFKVRDYDCTYIIRSEDLIEAEGKNKPATIRIHFPESYCSRILHNKLAFDILLEGILEGNIWKPAVKEDVRWEFYLHDGTPVNHTFLNSSDNDLPIANDEKLYANSQYLIFRVESITDHIESKDVIENIAGVDVITGHSVTPKTDVYILCENLLYRETIIEYVNGYTGDILQIESKNNTVLVDTSLAGGTITVDLKTDIQTTDNLVVVTPPSEKKKFWGLSVNKNNLPSVISTDETIDIDFKNNAYDISVNKDKLPGVLLPDILESDNTVNIETNSNGDYEISVNRDVVKTEIVGDDFITPTKDSNSDSDVWNLTFNESLIKCRKRLEKVKPNGFIDVSTSYNKQYYSTTANLDLTFNNLLSIGNEMMEIHLFYKPTEMSTITGWLNAVNGNFSWAMNTASPTFKPNRLYSITFTCIPAIDELLETAQVIGRVNWFRDI